MGGKIVILITAASVHVSATVLLHDSKKVINKYSAS